VSTVRPLRIAVWHNLPSGGGKRALHAHIDGLLKRGHHLEIWCPDRRDRGFLDLGELAKEHVVPLAKSTDKHALGEAIEVLRGTRSDVRAMDHHCRLCAKQIETARFDVVFANTSSDFAVTAIGRFTKLPSVLYLQEPLRELYEASPDLPWSTPDPDPELIGPQPTRGRPHIFRHALRVLKLGVLVREEQKNARAFDRILVNSYFSRESVLRAYGLESSVCYLGVDTTRFRDLGLEREAIVIGVGAVVPAKAIERAIEAIAVLDDDRPHLLWIGNVGDDAYRRLLQDLASRRSVDLEMKIDVSDDELIRSLNRASVMLYTPRLEPFGYAPLEASACGLPVVGVREGGLRETVDHGHTGFLADPDPQALSAYLTQILAEPNLGRRLGAAGRRWVEEHWTTTEMVNRLESHLAAVVHRRDLERPR
jgi:glycosyltransferase involved in cell wall biosynthesis